jgi:hypothetical protein
MDAQVKGMVTVGLLFIYYCWMVVVAVTAHAMHGVCVCCLCVRSHARARCQLAFLLPPVQGTTRVMYILV